MFLKKKINFKLLSCFFTLFFILAQVNIQNVLALQSSMGQNKIANIAGYRVLANNRIEIVMDKGATSIPSKDQFKLFEGVGTTGQAITISSVTAATGTFNSGYLDQAIASGYNAPQGSNYLLTTGGSFNPGTTYTIVMSNTLVGGTGFTLGHTHSNQDVSFSFACPDTLNSGSNANSVYNSSVIPTVNFMPGNNTNNVSLEGNVGFNVSVPVANYDDVKNGLVLKRNGTTVSYAPFTTPSSSSTSYDCYAPLYNDDHTFFGFFLTQGTSTYYDFNWKPNSTYELSIPEIHTINNQVIPAQTLTFHTMDGDTPNKLTGAVTATQSGNNVQIGWSAVVAGPSGTENAGWPAADGYNVYVSTDPYWNFVKLNSSLITGTTYTADISGLTPNITYYVRVSPSYNGYEGGRYCGSSLVTFVTPTAAATTTTSSSVSSSEGSSGSSSSGSSSGSTVDPTLGNGQGIGFGVGTPKPLKYIGSYLTTITNDVSSTGASVDNSTSVPLLPTIKMVFDKNLVNAVVWEQNKACFTLKDSSGNTVPVDVFCISDGMDPVTGVISGEGNFDERQHVFIKPVSSLNPGETYKIIVSPKLLARNLGSVLSDTTDDKGVVVTFTTVKDGALGATANIPSVSISVETKTDSNSNVVATVDSSKIKDNVVNEIQIKEPKPESRIQVQIPVDAVKKGLAGFGINTDSVKLNIPAGVIDASSLSNGTTLQISKNLMPAVDANALLANAPKGDKNIGKVFTFSMALCDSKNSVVKDIHNFASGKSVAVTINLSSDDIKGMDKSKISAFYFDTASKSWVDIGGSFDEKSMTYTFNTTHFTDFTIMEKSSTLLENIKRLAGVDRIETSIAIAKEQFKDKAPDAVVLTTANSFPDALSGEGLAYKYNAPMLLINKSVDESKNVLDYITSTLSKDKNIYILGGAGVVGDDISDYLISQGYKVVRIDGKDRYETNQKIFDTLNVTTGTSIFLANGNGFADALSISSIAALKGYPVLLSEKDNLSTNVINDIANIQPTNLYIIGGIGSLSADIEAQIKNIKGNINIVRLGGNDRYETSMKIAEYFTLDTDTITIANGSDFPDALSGSVLAARRNSGILLIDNTDTTRQKELLNKRDVKNVIVFGGEGVISSDIANSLMQK